MNIKKVFAVLLAAIIFVLIPAEAFAEVPDFSTMTDEELHELISGARNELKKRELNAEADMVLVEQDGVKLYLTGEYSVYGSDKKYIEFYAVVVNDSDKDISVNVDSAKLNGWDVYGSATGTVTANSKKKCDLSFCLSDAEIETYEEIEDIVLKLYLYDNEEWKRISDVEPMTIHFN